MLSKLLQHARNVLPAQITLFSKESDTEASSVPATMVATRQNRGRNSDTVPDTSLAVESLPSDAPSPGSKKRRRTQPTGDLVSHTRQRNSVSTTSTRKRQRLPLREKDETQFERHTHIAVEIPVRDIMQEDTPMWTAPEQTQCETDAPLAEDKPSVLEVEKENGLMGTGKGENYVLNTTDDEAIEGAVSIPKISEKIASKRAQKTKAEPKSDRNSKSSPERNKIANISEMKQPKHKRFGSEEPEVEEFEQEVKAEDKGDEETSSDDDAPEVVGKDDAQGKAADTARSAAKAFERQDAVLRKKRKERDEHFKRQAEATSKKRKHIDHSADGNTTSVSPLNNVGRSSRQDSPSALNGNLKQSKSGNTKTKTKIPEFLPMEFLEDEDASDNSPVSLTPQTIVHKSKKTKFLDSTTRKPKDRRRGSTIYRVVEAYGNDLLAPKAAKHARSVKESWLNGQRGSGGIRKVVRGGFFRK